MKIRLEFSDGREPVEVTPAPFDIVSFERKFHTTASKMDENTPLEHIYFLAYSACRRIGVAGVGESFDDFLVSLADIKEQELPPPPPQG